MFAENFVCDAFFITDIKGLTFSYSLETTTMIFLDSSVYFTVQFRMIPSDLIVRLPISPKTRQGRGDLEGAFQGTTEGVGELFRFEGFSDKTGLFSSYVV